MIPAVRLGEEAQRLRPLKVRPEDLGLRIPIYVGPTGTVLHDSEFAIKQMLRQKSGSIVNVSTTLVDQPIAGVGAAVQIMLKGALNAVTGALAIEYAKDGIRINTIAPGVINTPMHKPETHDFLKGLHPVHRIGEVKEVVDAALFLTDATFTTGEILHVDGGAHAGKW